MLAAIGRGWPFPFSDSSAVPTHLAAVFGASLGASVVAEGTAGQFLSAPKLQSWKRRGQLLPPVLRGVVGATIRSSGLWRRGGMWEKLSRVAGRSPVLPPAAAYLVKNALDGTTYRVPPPMLAELGQAIAGPLEGLPGGPTGTEAFTVASVTIRSAGRYAAKVLGPLSLRGLSAAHPYLAQAAIENGLATRGEWSRTATRRSSSLNSHGKCPVSSCTGVRAPSRRASGDSGGR